MNQEVNKQLTGGGDLTKSIIDGRLPKQQRQTRKKLENNAKVKKTKISKEQGFRNYMKYTDPLLLTNNEDLDKSELNDNISQLLEISNPQQINNDRMQEVKKIVSKEEPVDVSDFANEVMNKSASKIQGLVKGVQFRKNILPNVLTDNINENRNRDIYARTMAGKRAEKIQKEDEYERKKDPFKELSNEAFKSTSFVKRKEAIEKLQAVARSKVINEKFIEGKKAVEKIQAVYKGKDIRKQIEKIYIYR